MSWFRLDDKVAFHRKVLRAKNEAFGAFCRAGAVSSGEGTDGRVTLETCLVIGPQRLWDKLIEVGLVDRIEGSDDLQLHDYVDWNPTAAAIAASIEAKRRAGSKGGTSKAVNVAAARAPAGAGAAADTKQPPSIIQTKPNQEETEEPGQAGSGSLFGDGEAADRKSKQASVEPIFDAYLEGWRRIVGHGTEPVLTEKRKRLARARLREHDFETVRRAAAGIWCSKWHVDERRTDFDLAVRDAGQVERFANEYDARTGGNGQSASNENGAVGPFTDEQRAAAAEAGKAQAAEYMATGGKSGW